MSAVATSAAPVHVALDVIQRSEEQQRVAAEAEEQARFAQEQREKTIREFVGATVLEQELVDALRTMRTLPKATPMSALREIARAAAGDRHGRKLGERLVLVTLRTIAESPMSADATDMRAFIDRQLLRMAKASVKTIRTMTEHLERQVDDLRHSEVILSTRSFEWATRHARVLGYSVPSGGVDELAWRTYWLAKYAGNTTVEPPVEVSE